MSSRPASPAHQDSLDGIRAAAALTVVVLHVAGETGETSGMSAIPRFIGHGDIGVAIFFVLSGLLLYRPWATALFSGKAGPETVPYLWRRFWRVVPAFWLAVAIGLLAFNPEHADEWRTWAQLLGMVSIYDFSPWWPGTGPTGIYHLWTISLEMSFYLVLPLLGAALAAVAGRATAPAARARRALLGLAALYPLHLVYQYFTYFPEWRPTLSMWLPRSLPWFALGMALSVVAAWAAAEPSGPARRFSAGVGAALPECWTAAGLLYLISCTELTGPFGLNFGYDMFWPSIFRVVLYGAVSVLLVAPLALHPGNRHRLAVFFGSRPMAWLGRVSYGIYLWHAILLLVLVRLLGPRVHTLPFAFGVLLALTLLVTLPAAGLSHRFLEEPVRRLGTRWTVRRRRDEQADRGAAQQLRHGAGEARAESARKETVHSGGAAREGE
ncbi:acyltransferase family protein [Actinocorallia herbida]|uniref:acyltransferase family protein n=1 Tax=Actinocorallia herbida TaxID=58109 RepID=UPI001FE78A34|nr:acyltransferase [Actinocorallia herbida]